MVESNNDEWDYGNEDDDENMDWQPALVRKDSDAINNLASISKTVQVLKVDEIKPHIMATIARCRDVYELNKDDMYLVAKHYKWNEENMQQWFGDQEHLQHTLGLEPKPNQNKDRKLSLSLPENLKKQGNVCLICYEELTPANKFALDCRHTFCKDCQNDYLRERLHSDIEMTTANCMQDGCNMKVPHSIFLVQLEELQVEANKKIGSHPDKKLVNLYWKWMTKSFSDNNPNIKWCPQAGCEGCFLKSPYDNASTVQCICGTPVCLFCSQEAHGPCDCENSRKWIYKSKAESENMTWIMANTKGCPKCKKPIEKNQGCNHMQCRECNHGFCWVCLGDWKDHGSGSGGYYKCNKYTELAASDKKFKQAEDEREKASNELRRYLFYFERFMNHEKSQNFATSQRPHIDEKITQLQEIKAYPIQELEFMREAIDTVKVCRCVLKWTYAYGYFQSKLREQDKARFEFWQEDLEKFCDALQGMIEKPMDRYLDPNILDRSPFYKFKGELTAQYTATKKHHESLVKGLEEFKTM